MKRPIEQRWQIIQSLVNKEIEIAQAAQLLDCSPRTIQRQKKAFLEKGEVGLIDHRHSNYHKLSLKKKEKVVEIKEKDRWRSARNVRDKLELPVHRITIWRVFKEKGLNRENLKQIKPITRFEALSPNDLWQTDIMGKIYFPKLGFYLYLIATIDDHSRFCLSGRWFKKQGKMNVFQIWYESLARWGLPEKILQDEGSQYKARVRFGQADYQWYAERLGIKLIWAKRAEVKGKIERFWRFVQTDFVREVLLAKTIEEVNGNFNLWLARYNYRFRSESFGGKTKAELYHPSERKLSRIEIQTLLIVEERRKVTRQSTISLYGQQYYVPRGYINCRIWVKIIGNKVYFEANGEIFWKTRLKG